MRRKAREIAVQSLFQSEFAPQLSLKEIISATELAEYDSESIKFAEDLLAGIKDKRPQIDSRIQAASQHWKLERMASVDRNILRLAVYELEFAIDKIQPAIIINEAIEIAKVFGTQDSASFINGILDQIRKGN
jgi:N utilization substance protein B